MLRLGFLRRLPLWPVALTAAVLGVYLVDGLAWHPGVTSRFCSTGADRLAHWDGGWYTYIADHGYTTIPGSTSNPRRSSRWCPGWRVGCRH